MHAEKLFVTDELLYLLDWYTREKEIVKNKICQSDEKENRKLLSRLSFYNTQLLVVEKHMDELRLEMKEKGLLKINNWQLN